MHFMKKFFVFFLMAVATTTFFASCEKLKDAVFEAFEAPYSFDVNIPIVTNTSSEITLAETNVRFNLDSIIRANTGNVFGANIIGDVRIKEVGFEVLEGNANTNLTNFAYVKMEVGASGGTPTVMGPFNIPSTATSSVSFPVGNSFNIKSLFSGTTVNFKISGKATKATTQIMKVRVNTLMAFDK